MKEIKARLDSNIRHTLAGLLGLLPAHIKCAHYTSEGVRVFDDGQKYHVFPDGTTVWLASAECSFQLEGCRYPLAWAKWHLWRFFSKSPERLPAVLLAFALAGMGFAWLAICPADQNPFGEWALWVFPMLATGFVFAMNLCLGWLLLSVVVVVTARPVAEMVVDAVREAKAPALPAGEAMLLDMGGLIAPDVLVCYDSPDERPDVFADKLLAARRQFGADKYIVAVPFGSDKMVVCCPADADVKFPEEILNVRQEMGGMSGDVSAETWQDYTDFLQRAAKPVRNFCTNHRAKTQGAAAALVASLRVVLLLLAFASSAFAQPKTARLKAYLAERATLIVPPQGAEFKASFQLAPIVRTGDGKKTLLELLQSGAAFTDADNAGPLLAVYVGGKLLAPDTQKAAQPARASVGQGSAVPVGSEKGYDFLASTDSASIRGWEQAVISGTKKLGKEVAPRWGFVYFLFNYLLLPILAGVSLLAYFVAKSAFKEMGNSGNMVFLSRPLLYWGYRARNVVWGCAVLVGLMLLVDGLVNDITAGNSLWEWLMFSAFKMFLLYHLVIWVTPDPPKQPASQNNYPNQANRQHQLPDSF